LKLSPEAREVLRRSSSPRENFLGERAAERREGKTAVIETDKHHLS